MDGMGQALAKIKQQYEGQETGPSLVQMIGLPPTEQVREEVAKVEEEIANYHKEPSHPMMSRAAVMTRLESHLNRAQKKLALCEQRDVIKAERPEDCWCLGSGSSKAVHDRNGVRDVFCPCEEGQKAEEAYHIERRQRIDQAKAREIDRIWHHDAGIPEKFRGWRLDTSPLTEIAAMLRCPKAPDSEILQNEDIPENAKAVQEWIDKIERFERSWFLWGQYGRGKTGLAIGYAFERLCHDEKYVEPRRISVLFRSVPDLLSELRSTYGRYDGPSEQEVLDRYTGVDLLVLDDLGAEHVSGSGWLEDRLYQVIGTRHREEKSIFFTSNLSVKELADRIGERIVWRIVEMCGPDNIIEVQGKNLRDLKA